MEPETDTTLERNPAPDLQEQAPALPGGQAPVSIAEAQPAMVTDLSPALSRRPTWRRRTKESYEEEAAEEYPRCRDGRDGHRQETPGRPSLESITLVEGDPESGKSVVIEQLAFNALREGLKVVSFLSETKPRQFLDQMQSLGMPSMDYYLIRRLSLYPANLRVDQDKAERIMHKLLRYLETAGGADVVIFDSVTPLLFQFDARYVLSFLATCKELANLGKTIIVSLHSYAINESLRLRADSIVDAHLRLRIEELGKQVVRTLEVSKIRGAVKTIGNSVSFTVEPGIGLKTVPISKTKA
jgi:flagellar protein FlaH